MDHPKDHSLFGLGLRGNFKMIYSSVLMMISPRCHRSGCVEPRNNRRRNRERRSVGYFLGLMDGLGFFVFFRGSVWGRVKFGICDIICDIQLLIILRRYWWTKIWIKISDVFLTKKQEGQHSCKMIVRCIIWIDLAMQLFPKLRWSILSRSGEDGLDFVPELLIQRWVCQGSAGQPRGQGEQIDWILHPERLTAGTSKSPI